MGLLEKTMESTLTSSKVFKQQRILDDNEKNSFQVRCLLDA